MECQTSDSKKLFKVFDASKRKRVRRRHDGPEVKSVASDTSGCQANHCCVVSAKASLQDMSSTHNDGIRDSKTITRDSSPSVSRSPGPACRGSRSPRRHRRPMREGISLALKAGLVSTPRSASPPQTGDGIIETVPQDHDSFIYAFLEEAIKRDKKKQRHARRHEERRASRERDASPPSPRDHRHRHRRDDPSRDRDKPQKIVPPGPAIDQTALFETFAKICAQCVTMNKPADLPSLNPVPRSLSHKSLQCEVTSRQSMHDVDQRPVKLRSHENSRELIPSTRIRSQENCRERVRSRDHVGVSHSHMQTVVKDKCGCYDPYDKEDMRYGSKIDVGRSRTQTNEDRYRDYTPRAAPTRSFLDNSYRRNESRDCRAYEEPRESARRRNYDEEKRRYFDQKTSRSYDVHREGYADEERARRSARSDVHKEKRYDDRRYDDRDGDKRYQEIQQRDKYYDEKPMDVRDRHCNNMITKERRYRRNLERFDRVSIISKDDDYKDKDMYSERERDSGLSVADGETSTVSGRSNYLRVVKQEIIEQREAMDKMMKLWKELMRCFKGISQTEGPEKAVHESAANNARESAAAQLRLWRECMRRYETVARDVGDTDARLMEEINKQRSEMSEMAGMWQECLQRYREMSNDFDKLKQKLATAESPTRAPAPPVCAEGEGPAPAPYRLPPTYPPMPPMGGYPGGASASPLRSRASVPPAWWWSEQPGPTPRRRSSPDSRGSRDRDRERDRRHRHKDRERDDTRYKEKSKPSGARSEHRHRKR
ncbi:uncharacterized protein [Choristoneura fumiferana]|uniref:uncharacterized protein n=1 Tax=Choristoneura fumiferana TaxID=7141 RepID=UPI003D155FD3